jgi:MinD superfamily P-loop ATPase
MERGPLPGRGSEAAEWGATALVPVPAETVCVQVVVKRCLISKEPPATISTVPSVVPGWLENRMKISVASGKGGTGKTLVATSLALSLKGKHRVQLLDCDVEEPNAYIFLKPTVARTEAVCIPVPVVDEAKCTYCGRCAEVCAYNAVVVFPKHVLVFPNLCHGCGACSYLCPEGAITEVEKEIGDVASGQADGINFVQGRLTVGEAMPTPVIREVKSRADDHGVVIIDAPPGTSCPVVQSIKDSDFCLLVTEPTPFGLNDLVLAVETAKELNVPYGVVINRTGTGDAGVEAYCLKEEIPVLLTIPLDTRISRFYSCGVTLAEGLPEWQERFSGLFDRITEIVNERSRCPER